VQEFLADTSNYSHVFNIRRFTIGEQIGPVILCNLCHKSAFDLHTEEEAAFYQHERQTQCSEMTD